MLSAAHASPYPDPYPYPSHPTPRAFPPAGIVACAEGMAGDEWVRGEACGPFPGFGAQEGDVLGAHAVAEMRAWAGAGFTNHGGRGCGLRAARATTHEPRATGRGGWGGG